MTKWECPHCHDKVEARASEVSHRCPSNKNQMTRYKRVDG